MISSRKVLNLSYYFFLFGVLGVGSDDSGKRRRELDVDPESLVLMPTGGNF